MSLLQISLNSIGKGDSEFIHLSQLSEFWDMFQFTSMIMILSRKKVTYWKLQAKFQVI